MVDGPAAGVRGKRGSEGSAREHGEHMGVDLVAENPVVVEVTVNGTRRSLVVPSDRRLLGLLRNDLRLTGSKAGCEVGVCGACTVLVDGRPTSSCTFLAVQADGREVVTVEAASEEPRVRALQDAFVEEGGFQCGFCTSGQIMAAAALLSDEDARDMSAEEVRYFMLGNLCRCTGYYGILRAIEAVRGHGS